MYAVNHIRNHGRLIFDDLALDFKIVCYHTTKNIKKREEGEEEKECSWIEDDKCHIFTTRNIVVEDVYRRLKDVFDESNEIRLRIDIGYHCWGRKISVAYFSDDPLKVYDFHAAILL